MHSMVCVWEVLGCNFCIGQLELIEVFCHFTLYLANTWTVPCGIRNRLYDDEKTKQHLKSLLGTSKVLVAI